MVSVQLTSGSLSLSLYPISGKGRRAHLTSKSQLPLRSVFFRSRTAATIPALTHTHYAAVFRFLTRPISTHTNKAQEKVLDHYIPRPRRSCSYSSSNLLVCSANMDSKVAESTFRGSAVAVVSFSLESFSTVFSLLIGVSYFI